MSRAPVHLAPRADEGNAAWRALANEPTYSEQWTRAVDDLRRELGLWLQPKSCADCGRPLSGTAPWCRRCRLERASYDLPPCPQARDMWAS